MEFLMKMNPKYQHIKSSILMMKEPPSAVEAYRILMQEQTHEELSKSTHVQEQEMPIACKIENKRKYGEKGKFVQSKKASYNCEHCKIHGHSIERCWKIHEYPPNYRPNTWKKETVGKANTVQTNTQHEERHIEPKLTQEQYNTLMSFLSTQPDTNSKEPSMATSAHFEGQCSLYV